MPVPSLSASASSAASTPSPRTIGRGFPVTKDHGGWGKPLPTPDLGEDVVEVFVVAAPDAEHEAYAAARGQRSAPWNALPQSRSRSALRSQKSLADIRQVAQPDQPAQKRANGQNEREPHGGLGGLITRLKSRSSNTLRAIAAGRPLGDKASKGSASAQCRFGEQPGVPPVPVLPDAQARTALPRRDTEPHQTASASHQPLRGPASAPPTATPSTTATSRARSGSLLFQLPDDPFASFATRKSADLDRCIAAAPFVEEADSVQPTRPAFRSHRTAPSPSRPTTVVQAPPPEDGPQLAPPNPPFSASATPAEPSVAHEGHKGKGGFLGTLRRPASFKNLFHLAHGHPGGKSTVEVLSIPPTAPDAGALPHSASDQFVYDISAPPVPNLPSLPSVPSLPPIFARPSLTVDTAVGGTSTTDSPNHLGATPDTAGPAVSGSFYDLYAELGIDPPVAEPTSAYAPAYPSGLASWVAEKSKADKDKRGDLEADALTLSVFSEQDAPCKVHEQETTPKKRQRKARPPGIAIPPVRSLSAPPPRLECLLSARSLLSNTSLPPIPLASPLIHILPWSDEVFAQTKREREQSPDGTMLSEGVQSGYKTLPPIDIHSGGKYGRLNADEDDSTCYRRAAAMEGADSRLVDDRQASASSGAGASHSQHQGKEASRLGGLGNSSFRTAHGAGRNRERSGSSRSASSSRERRYKTSSPAAVSSDESSSDSDSNPGLESEERLATSQSSDDVPLAQRIPGALQMQKSMQKQRRDDRRARNARKQRDCLSENVQVAARIDGRDNRRWMGEGGVPARELSNLLEKVVIKQARQQETATSVSSPIGLVLPLNTVESLLARQGSERSHEATHGRQRSATITHAGSISAAGAPSRHVSTRRTVRTADATREPTPVMPSTAQFARSGTASLRPAASHSSLAQSDTEWLARSTSHKRTNSREASSTTTSPADRPLVAPLAIKPRRHGVGSPHIQQSPASPLLEGSHPRSRKTSGDNAAPAILALPCATEQRVLIGSAQGAAESVQLHAHTTCAEVIQSLQTRGSLRGDRAANVDWVMFEIFGELGLGKGAELAHHSPYLMPITTAERPIRSFEYLLPIMRGWNSDIRANAFLVKLSPNIRLTTTSVRTPSDHCCSALTDQADLHS